MSQAVRRTQAQKNVKKLPVRQKAQVAKQKKSILSEVSQEYAMALADPFDGPLASIPDFPSTPSRRLRVYSRGFATSGTSQVGFICLDPFAASRNDVASVYASAATYAGTAFATTGVGVQPAVTNSDYADADYGAGTALRGRVVAAGLRVRFSSTELNRGGVAVGLITPNHNSLDGIDFPTADTYECSRRFRPGQDWMTVLYCPVFDFEMQFTDTVGAFATPSPIMGFIFQAPDPSVAVSYEYEAYVMFEVQGINARGLQPSFADPAGFAVVQTAAQLNMMAPQRQTRSSFSGNFLKTIEDMAVKTLTGIGTGFLTAALL